MNGIYISELIVHKLTKGQNKLNQGSNVKLSIKTCYDKTNQNTFSHKIIG